jgi:nitrogen PTS system EIIA component
LFSACSHAPAGLSPGRRAASLIPSDRRQHGDGDFFGPVVTAVLPKERFMKLSDFVVPDAIVPDLQVSSKDEAIRAMVRSLKECGAIGGGDEDSIVAAILKREELGSTGIGNGVAVPHTKHPSVDRLIATVALSKDGVDFASLDSESVYILFLLVSPPDRPGDHLRGLENISRHLRNQNFCKFLKQAKTRQEVIDLLHEADTNQLD